VCSKIEIGLLAAMDTSESGVQNAVSGAINM